MQAKNSIFLPPFSKKNISYIREQLHIKEQKTPSITNKEFIKDGGRDLYENNLIIKAINEIKDKFDRIKNNHINEILSDYGKMENKIQSSLENSPNSLLNSEEIRNIKLKLENILCGENKRPDKTRDEIINLISSRIDRVYFNPPLYLGKELSNLTKEEMRWFRMRLGIPQKVNNKWFRLPTPIEMNEKYRNLKYNTDNYLNPIRWVKSVFSEYLDANLLHQDQLGVLDDVGLRALKNYLHRQGRPNIVPPKEKRVSNEINLAMNNRMITIAKDGYSLEVANKRR